MATVRDPAGIEWTVERRWTPWRVRRRFDATHLDFDAAGVVFWLAAWLLMPVEYVVAFLCGAVLHLFDRPWRVIATSANPPRQQLTWRVRGGHASLREVEEIAARIRAGEPRLWESADARRTL
ncbi:hypothetical protein VSS74_01990 [Conexibacter stalactiti]|uniref:Uncharacterized protein n=1 Tax=Conexibacter stalactiti TaxID=1940611 RepID=A0ABU4HIF2_9ACTN|nr:hypothetical protein [Conexibacter stalactiti]MDW5593091.1 hypothetical protein [Conexibacter stalactiti]MEC5033732.1 hypothetical protein [Conexibacter stalactiti]